MRKPPCTWRRRRTTTSRGLRTLAAHRGPHSPSSTAAVATSRVTPLRRATMVRWKGYLGLTGESWMLRSRPPLVPLVLHISFHVQASRVLRGHSSIGQPSQHLSNAAGKYELF